MANVTRVLEIYLEQDDNSPSGNDLIQKHWKSVDGRKWSVSRCDAKYHQACSDLTPHGWHQDYGKI